jgi:hypothetical protein
LSTFRKPKTFDYNQPNPSPYPGKALGVTGGSPPDLSVNALPVGGSAPIRPVVSNTFTGLPARRLLVSKGNLGG